MKLRLRRAYDDAAPEDGYRVLVDRVWPRGRSREALSLDEWMRDVAPSTELRKWFHHDPDRFEEFRARYREELRREPALSKVRELAVRASQGTLTLVFGAKDPEHNQAVVLAEAIREAGLLPDAHP